MAEIYEVSLGGVTGATMYIPRFIKTGRGIQTGLGGDAFKDRGSKDKEIKKYAKI
jgi:hypothetical protein